MQIEDRNIDLDGKALLLRNAKKEEAAMLLEYLKTTCKETRYLVKEPEEITLTLEQEVDFIESNNKSKSSMMLIGFLDGEYVGNISLMGNDNLRYRHRAELGIALYLKYAGQGIGRAMIEAMIDIAKEIGLEQLELEVIADNKRALHLYESLGFEIFGRFPNNMKYKDGTYADGLWMMKTL